MNLLLLVLLVSGLGGSKKPARPKLPADMGYTPEASAGWTLLAEELATRGDVHGILLDSARAILSADAAETWPAWRRRRRYCQSDAEYGELIHRIAQGAWSRVGLPWQNTPAGQPVEPPFGTEPEGWLRRWLGYVAQGYVCLNAATRPPESY